MSLTRGVIGNLLWVAWGKVARAALQFLVLVVLARLLTPADFGVVNAALVAITFSTILAQIGLGPALVQRPVLEPRHLAVAFAGSVSLSLLLGALVWAAAPAIATFFHMPRVEPVLRVLVLAFPLRGLAVVSEALLQREMRFRWLANREVLSFALGYGAVGITLGLMGWGVWALVWAHLAQAALNTVLVVAGQRPPLRVRPDWAAARDLAHFSGGFTMARIANYLAHQGDNLVIGRWLGPTALGLYGRAYQLMALPADIVGGILDSVLFPAMAKVQGDVRRLRDAYCRGVSLVALLMLPLSALFLVLAPEVVRVVLGARWQAAEGVFRIFALGLLLRTSYRMSDSLARATGAVYSRAWRQALYAALIVGGAWAGQHWGLEGAAWGVLGALTVNFVLMAQLSLSTGRLSWGSFLAAHAAPARLAAAVGGIAWLLVSGLRELALMPAARLLITLSLAAASAAALASLCPRLFLGPNGAWMVRTARTFLPPPFGATPLPSPPR